MKKTKIILPAIALLAVSGIASVTGTVAWFTASQSAKITMSNVVAMNTTGNLTVEFKHETSKSGNDEVGVDMYGFTPSNWTAGTGIAGTFGNLRDASYDMTNNKVYSAIFDSTTTTETAGTIVGYNEVAHGASVVDDNSQTVYYCVEFTATFSVANVGDNDKYSLFFNAKDSALTSTSTKDSEIAPAFRVAMKASGDSNHSFVWAPKAATSSTKFDYVNGTGTTSKGAYEVGKDALVTSTDVYNTNTVATGNAKTNLCLCPATITKSASTVDVHFAFWFEGEDTNCKAANVDGIVSSLAMSFYAVLNPAN